jgi:hypothetical protein
MTFRALRKQTRCIYEVYEHDRFVYSFSAFVARNSMQVATIEMETIVNTVCVFQPLCTNALRWL